jgi:hypothetical protein
VDLVCSLMNGKPRDELQLPGAAIAAGQVKAPSICMISSADLLLPVDGLVWKPTVEPGGASPRCGDDPRAAPTWVASASTRTH